MSPVRHWFRHGFDAATLQPGCLFASSRASRRPGVLQAAPISWVTPIVDSVYLMIWSYTWLVVEICYISRIIGIVGWLTHVGMAGFHQPNTVLRCLLVCRNLLRCVCCLVRICLRYTVDCMELINILGIVHIDYDDYGTFKQPFERWSSLKCWSKHGSVGLVKSRCFVMAVLCRW